MSHLNADYEERRFPDRNTWLAARRMMGLGGSEAATAIGENPYDDPMHLWGIKTGKIQPDDLSDNAAVQWGTRLEGVISDHYHEVTGRIVRDPGEFTIALNKNYQWMFCTPDRYQTDHEKGEGVLQIKTAGAHMARHYKDDFPLMHQIQMQHEMICTGRKWGTLAVLVGGRDFRYKDYDLDENFAKALIESERRFWNCCTTGLEPEITGTTACLEAVKLLHPNDNGETVVLPKEAKMWEENLRYIKEEIASSKKEQAAMEAHLRGAIGDATYGTIDDITFSLKSQERKEHMVKASTSRVLRLVKKGKKK